MKTPEELALKIEKLNFSDENYPIAQAKVALLIEADRRATLEWLLRAKECRDIGDCTLDENGLKEIIVDACGECDVCTGGNALAKARAAGVIE